MAKKYKLEEDGVHRVEAVIIGYTIPDLSGTEAARESVISPEPVFSSEKGVYKKSLIFSTVEEAKAKILERYKREQ